ncbi:MAG: hypothetical protein ABH950_06630 [Candidatus Altiarchaeota archaeon]
MKKGMLFTVGLTLLALTILSMSSMYRAHTQRSQDGTFELLAVDRAWELESSMEKEIRSIFENTSGIEYNKTGLIVTFKESLNNSDAQVMNESITKFEAFLAQTNYTSQGGLSAALNLGEVKDHSTLVIHPYDVSYTHPILSGNTLQVKPDDYHDIKRYFVKFTIPDGKDRDNCTFMIPPYLANDTVQLTVQVLGPMFSCGMDGLVAVNEHNWVSVNDTSGNNFTLTLNDWATLSMNWTGASAINPLITEVTIEDPTPSELFIGFPKNSLVIDFPQYNFSSVSFVRLL